MSPRPDPPVLGLLADLSGAGEDGPFKVISELLVSAFADIDAVVEENRRLTQLVEQLATVNAARIPPPPRADPVVLTSARINDEGALILVMSDGTELNAGLVRSAPPKALRKTVQHVRDADTQQLLRSIITEEEA